MKNNTTEWVFILDKSDSICSMEEDEIGSFNYMIEKQKQPNGMENASHRHSSAEVKQMIFVRTKYLIIWIEYYNEDFTIKKGT